jgi:hypothetical protein
VNGYALFKRHGSLCDRQAVSYSKNESRFISGELAMASDLSEISRVKDRVEAEILRRPGVIGVDVGFRYVGGRRTDEIAIRVFVTRKLDDVPNHERIPDQIDGIRTDVIERTFSPVNVNDRDRYDPVQGGCSIGRDVISTVGAVVRDRGTGNPVVLTTFHGEGFLGEDEYQPSGLQVGRDRNNRLEAV